jgi:hypothetical protein
LDEQAKCQETAYYQKKSKEQTQTLIHNLKIFGILVPDPQCDIALTYRGSGTFSGNNQNLTYGGNLVDSDVHQVQSHPANVNEIGIPESTATSEQLGTHHVTPHEVSGYYRADAEGNPNNNLKA